MGGAGNEKQGRAKRQRVDSRAIAGKQAADESAKRTKTSRPLTSTTVAVPASSQVAGPSRAKSLSDANEKSLPTTSSPSEHAHGPNAEPRDTTMLRELNEELIRVSRRLIAALPPPSVSLDLELRLLVLDLDKNMTQCEALVMGSAQEMGFSDMAALSPFKRKKGDKVIELWKGLAECVPRTAEWRAEYPDFEQALVDLGVRIRLWEQLRA